MRIACEGLVVTGGGGEPLCVDDIGSPVAWTAVADAPEIDLETVGGPFSAGFGLVLLFWALGKGVALVIDVFRH